MSFLSPTFMFIFLPLAMGFYTVMPKFRRAEILPIISTVFFVCVNIHDLLSLVYYIGITASLVAVLSFYKKNKKRHILIGYEIAVGFASAAMVFYRLAYAYSAVYHAGLVLCFMSVISLCSDILREDGRVPDSPWDSLIYVTFFPTSLVGPFVRYADFVQKLDNVKFSLVNFNRGACRFMIGVVKCLGVSAVLGQAYDKIYASDSSLGLLVFILLSVLLGFEVFSFFSGYSDMARGLALMLGIEIDRDFGDPFRNSTPAMYVRRFFKSFSSFCKLYIADGADNAFGKNAFGKIIASLLAGSFYVFIICRAADSALLLLIPASVVAYFVMFRSGVSRRVRLPVWLKVPGGIITFFAMSLTFMIVKLEGIGAMEDIVIDIVSNPVTYMPYKTLAEIVNLKHLIVPAVTSLLLMLFAKLLCSNEENENYTVQKLVIKSVSSLALITFFILCIVLLLPQFPALVSFEDGFSFI